MAKRKANQRSRELGLIHILANQLSLTRQQYEAVLWANQAGCESSAGLDAHGRQKVIEHLKARVQTERRDQRPANISVESRKALTKIEALLADAGLPWTYAVAILKQQTKGRKQRLEWAHEGELASIVASLEKAALKRLKAELQAIFGEMWADVATYYAAYLFDFDSDRRNVTCYSETMSAVLRWWRGQLPAVCAWPVDLEKPDCCGWCAQRAMAQQGRTDG